MTDEGRRTTGFSHGTAGIVYALLRLYEHTRDARLLETAKEAIAYEDTVLAGEPQLGRLGSRASQATSGSGATVPQASGWRALAV